MARTGNRKAILLDDVEHLGVELLSLHLFLVTGARLLECFEVSKDQLGVDGANVALGVNLAVNVNDVFVGEGAHHLGDRVGLTNVRQELVAEPLPR